MKRHLSKHLKIHDWNHSLISNKLINKKVVFQLTQNKLIDKHIIVSLCPLYPLVTEIGNRSPFMTYFMQEEG